MSLEAVEHGVNTVSQLTCVYVGSYVSGVPLKQ